MGLCCPSSNMTGVLLRRGNEKGHMCRESLCRHRNTTFQTRKEVPRRIEPGISVLTLSLRNLKKYTTVVEITQSVVT